MFTQTLHTCLRFIYQRALFFLAGLLVFVLSSLESFAQGCAMCQTVMPRGDEPMARGMLWSVTLLMTAPFVVGGTIGGWLYYCHRITHRTQRIRTAAVLPLPSKGEQEDSL